MVSEEDYTHDVLKKVFEYVGSCVAHIGKFPPPCQDSHDVAKLILRLQQNAVRLSAISLNQQTSVDVDEEGFLTEAEVYEAIRCYADMNAVCEILSYVFASQEEMIASKFVPELESKFDNEPFYFSFNITASISDLFDAIKKAFNPESKFSAAYKKKYIGGAIVILCQRISQWLALFLGYLTEMQQVLILNKNLTEYEFNTRSVSPN